MFSRYTSYNIPPNYSGNRFQKNNIYETTTKTHTADDFGAINSSVSPTFEESLSSASSFISQENLREENEDIVEYHEPIYEANDTEILDTSSQKSKEKNMVFETLGDIFSKIKSEDLLILCLIIFLSSEKGFNNNDIIILLSLLLVYN